MKTGKRKTMYFLLQITVSLLSSNTLFRKSIWMSVSLTRTFTFMSLEASNCMYELLLLGSLGGSQVPFSG
jgi:hypothetical protein